MIPRGLKRSLAPSVTMGVVLFVATQLSVACGATWSGASLRDAETRRGQAIVDLSTTLKVSATRVTPALAAALAERRCDARQCGDERSDLVAAARTRAARESRFVLAVYTAKLAWNDLADHESQWTLGLTVDGAKLAPTVRRAIRDLDAHARLFPDLDGFDRAYEVSFPVSPRDGQSQRLSVTGLHGELHLEWRTP